MDIDKLCVGCFNERGPTNICQHCGYDEDSEPEAQVYLAPRTILEKKYMIGRILGQGGFGITYLAWDLNLNIKLAIKEYFPHDLATRKYGQSQVAPYSGSMGSQYKYGLDKFLQEARTLAQFEGHPNIVSVRDYFQANNSAYLVMKYVEGITLKEHLARSGGKLSVDQARKIIMPIMDALIEVHTVNVLHRDVSPDNIFINEKGQVILIDFGAARQAVSDKGRSMSIILKPGYAPEEQYRSKGNQGPWTDVYALAATFYHLITGHQPPEALERITEDQLSAPSKLGITMNSGEEAALLKALAVRAKDRYQSMEEFQEAFMGDLLTASKKMAEPLEATPPPMEAQKAGEQKKRFPLGLVVGGGSALIVIAALLALLIGGSGEEQNMALTEETGEERDEIVINDSITPGFDEPTNYIESIEAYVTDLQFYESDGYETTEYEDMEFAKTFASAESRYMTWTIDLVHPTATSDRSIVITHKYYRPSGVIEHTISKEYIILADWTWSWHSWGYGWDEPGNWETGTWYVELLVDDTVIAAGSFDIVEDPGEEDSDGALNNDSVAPSFDEPTNYIESIEASVTDLQFYESGFDYPEHEDIVFSKTFANAETRFVNWMLNLVHPTATSDRSIVITQKYYRPSGIIAYIDRGEYLIPANWTESLNEWGYGWDEPGNWETGTWYVELLVDDTVIAAGSFEVK